jgi:hypothetical protein
MHGYQDCALRHHIEVQVLRIFEAPHRGDSFVPSDALDSGVLKAEQYDGYVRNFRALLAGVQVNDSLRPLVVEYLNFIAAQIRNCLAARAYGGDIEGDELGRRRLTECGADSQNKEAKGSAHK